MTNYDETYIGINMAVCFGAFVILITLGIDVMWALLIVGFVAGVQHLGDYL